MRLRHCDPSNVGPALPSQFHIIFVSVNAIISGRRSRTRDAIAAVRHVFLEGDAQQHSGIGGTAPITVVRVLVLTTPGALTRAARTCLATWSRSSNRRSALQRRKSRPLSHGETAHPGQRRLGSTATLSIKKCVQTRVRVDRGGVVLHQSPSVGGGPVIAVQLAPEHPQQGHLLPSMVRCVRQSPSHYPGSRPLHIEERGEALHHGSSV